MDLDEAIDTATAYLTMAEQARCVLHKEPDTAIHLLYAHLYLQMASEMNSEDTRLKPLNDLYRRLKDN